MESYSSYQNTKFVTRKFDMMIPRGTIDFQGPFAQASLPTNESHALAADVSVFGNSNHSRFQLLGTTSTMQPPTSITNVETAHKSHLSGDMNPQIPKGKDDIHTQFSSCNQVLVNCVNIMGNGRQSH